MSEITERLMRGEYISKAECLEHADELDRAFSVYGSAMAAYDRHRALMDKCVCAWDIDDEGRGVNTPPPTGCPSHPEEL
jgi:hypothetical protein